MKESRSVIEVVSKPWGFEKRIINVEQYCGKFLYIVKGKNTSMHYHRTKDETFYVHAGKIKVFYNESVQEIGGSLNRVGVELYNRMKSVTLNQGDNFRILPETVHQIFAVEDTQLYEFSSIYDEPETVVIEGV